MDQDPKTLRESQQLLAQFLDADLDLALASVRMSQTHFDADGSEKVKLQALKVVETVKHYQPRIEDARSSGRIRERVAELEHVIGNGAPEGNNRKRMGERRRRESR
jgi:hypothetical protein